MNEHDPLQNKDVQRASTIMEGSYLQDDNFRLFIEHAASAFFLTNPDDGSILLSNQAATDIFGYTNNEMLQIGRKALLAQDEELRILLEKRDNEGNAQGGATGIRKNGEHFPCSFSSAVFFMADGTKRTSTLITDLSETIKQSKETANHLKAIFDNTSEGLILLDANGKLKAFNAKAVHNHRLNKNIPDLEVGKKLIDYIGKGRKPYFESLFGKVLQGETVEYDIDYELENDEKIWFHTTLSPVKGEGKITGICVVRNEITERKNAEERIRYSEQKRSLIMNAAFDAIICIDLTGVVTSWNPQAEKIFGWNEAEVMGRLLSNIIIPEPYRKMHDEGIANYSRTGEGRALNKLLELSAINRQGEEFPIELTVMPIKQSGEEFFCAFIRNISQRKMQEKAIIESEKKYRNLFEGSPLAMWLFDCETLDILDVNDATVQLIGYTKEELLTMKLNHFWLDEDFQNNEERTHFFRTSKSIFQGTVRYKKKNGQIITTEIINHSFDFNSKNARLTQATDITQKLEAERIIQLSEQRFKALVQEGADLIAIVDMDANFQYMSPNSQSIIGTPAAFFIGKNARQFVHENDQERVSAYFKLLSTQKQVTIKPFRFEDANHNVHWIETIVTNMMDDPSIGGIVTNSRNVTQRVQHEIKLQESIDKYNTVAQATSDTIWDWDIVSDKMQYNQGMYQMFGYREAEVKNLAGWWKQNIHPDDLHFVSKAIDKIFEKKMIHLQVEYRFRCADGSYKDVFDRGFLLTDKEGRPIRMIGAMQDITQRKKTENEIKFSNERFELATRATNDAIFEWDILEDCIYWGEGLETLFGHKRVSGKMDNTVWHKNVHPNQIATLNRNLIGAFKKQVPTYDREYMFRCADGSYKVVFEKSIIQYNENGFAVKMFGALNDITESKKHEEEREHLIQELSQNNKNLRQFSFITSHNLRAPIANLLGLMQLVDTSAIQDPLMLEILNGVKTSAELLNETINDLSKVLVVKNNTAVPQEEVLLGDMLDKVISQVKNLIDEHKPIINTNFINTTHITFNRAYMESILLNLLTNAIKYRSPSRKLKIDISTSKKSGDKTILTFTDNGIGLDVERYKDRLFGLYQRFHNHPDSRGLGLYLVRSQIEALGGSIEINSKVGEGTTFTLLFKR